MFIKRNGKYFLEDIRCYHLVPNKEDATEVIDFYDAENYIKYDMGLRLNQVTLEDEEGTYRNHNGIWYNHETHYVCSRCGKIDKRVNCNQVNTINGEEELCHADFELMDSKGESYDEMS